MCHKTDSLDKCVHVSLKILDLGILDVASLTASSEGENTQDEDVMGEISAGAATPGECAEETLFSLFYWEDDVTEGLKQEIVDKKTMGLSYLSR